MQFPEASNAFDVDAFSRLIHSHGVEMVHWRAIVNPVGMIDKYDSRRPNQDQSNSSNGFLYTKAGTLTALLSSNSKDAKAFNGGIIDAGTAQITVPTTYDRVPPGQVQDVYLAPYDRFFLKENAILVTKTDEVNTHESGTDRLKFPAVKVLDLIDSNNVSFQEGVDFNIDNGMIVWCNRTVGPVFSVRYLHQPFWYVDHLSHEIRVAQQEDELGNVSMVRLPQAAIVKREYLFRNESKTPDDNNLRKTVAPPDSGFSSR